MTTQKTERQTSISRTAGRRWRRPSRRLLAVVVVVFVLLLVAFVPSRRIEARDVSSGDVLGCGKSITVRFTHSMFGGDV
ncbi:MAG: hypothetical protein M3Y37_07965, partial [Chloroflexota bacterium]|nr:hypothetical protein [Chloroflexota bacterium]